MSTASPVTMAKAAVSYDFVRDQNRPRRFAVSQPRSCYDSAELTLRKINRIWCVNPVIGLIRFCPCRITTCIRIGMTPCLNPGYQPIKWNVNVKWISYPGSFWVPGYGSRTRVAPECECTGYPGTVVSPI
eukprot:3312801-Rhodomonas_salina.4